MSPSESHGSGPPAGPPDRHASGRLVSAVMLRRLRAASSARTSCPPARTARPPHRPCALPATQLDSRTTSRHGTVCNPGAGPVSMASSSRNAAILPISARFMSIVVSGGRLASAMVSQLS